MTILDKIMLGLCGVFFLLDILLLVYVIRKGEGFSG